MLRYIHLWGNTFIGGYGLMIALGVVIGVGLGYLVMRRRGYDADDFLLLSAYGGLGAMIGAKALFLWTVRDYIDPSRLLDPTYELGALRPRVLSSWAGSAAARSWLPSCPRYTG